MNLLVAGRITGSVLIICAYFVILHVSTLYGAIMHVIADIICIPWFEGTVIHVIDKPKPKKKSKGFK